MLGMSQGLPFLSQEFLPMLTDQSNPMLFFAAVQFLEDELDDNGLTSLDVKLRVHEKFFFVLLKSDVRVDNVTVRRLEKRFLVFTCGEDRAADTRPKVETELLYMERSFEELRKRGDLPEGRPDLILEAGKCLRPETDAKYHFREQFTLY